MKRFAHSANVRTRSPVCDSPKQSAFVTHSYIWGHLALQVSLDLSSLTRGQDPSL